MSAPSKILTLLTPVEQAELNRRMFEKGYGDIDGFAELLAEWGYEISRSSVGRYSKKQQAKTEAYQASAARAAAIAAALPDDGAIADAVSKIASLTILEAIEAIDFSDPKSVANLAQLAKSQAALSMAALKMADWKQEYAKIIRKVEETLEASVRKGAISPDTLVDIRRDCFGLTDEEAEEYRVLLAAERGQ
jgi:hypothetical protein